MQNFSDLSIGDLFTLERKLKNNPHKPTIWRKKSSRTAWMGDGKAWFYFDNKTTVYKREQSQ
jgi:hypothetical protein|tara:strand:+ start:728 stop:913 length:186 start_codon:yes stop_codon:yes gene_type:complete